MRTNLKKINDWVLERYLLEELPKDKIEEISLQLKEDPDLRRALERLKQSNKEILAQPPPDTIIPGILNLYRGEKARLDDAPGFERFFFVTSTSTIDVEVKKLAPPLT